MPGSVWHLELGDRGREASQACVRTGWQNRVEQTLLGKPGEEATVGAAMATQGVGPQRRPGPVVEQQVALGGRLEPAQRSSAGQDTKAGNVPAVREYGADSGVAVRHTPAARLRR